MSTEGYYVSKQSAAEYHSQLISNVYFSEIVYQKSVDLNIFDLKHEIHIDCYPFKIEYLIYVVVNLKYLLPYNWLNDKAYIMYICCINIS